MADTSEDESIFGSLWNEVKGGLKWWVETESQKDQREHEQWLARQQQEVAPTSAGWTSDMQEMWTDQSETTKHLVKYMGYMTAVFAVLGVGYLVLNKKK